ncbi:hypothetical protein V8G54_033977, partial [Vigna mungo]
MTTTLVCWHSLNLVNCSSLLLIQNQTQINKTRMVALLVPPAPNTTHDCLFSLLQYLLIAPPLSPLSLSTLSHVSPHSHFPLSSSLFYFLSPSTFVTPCTFGFFSLKITILVVFCYTVIVFVTLQDAPYLSSSS